METARREGPNLLVSRHNAFPMGLDFRYFWPRIGKQRQVFQANVVGNTEYKEAMHQRVEKEDSITPPSSWCHNGGVLRPTPLK